MGTGGGIVRPAPSHPVRKNRSPSHPAPLSQGLTPASPVSSRSDTTGSPTPHAPPRTRANPGAPPTPPLLVPMYQDTSATAHLLALVLRGVAVHLVPRILWTVTPVYVGMMAILSVQAMTVAQLLPLPPQQPLLLLLPPPLPPQQPPQPPQPPPPPHHPPAPQCQALQQEQTASSPSPSRAPPTCPALSGSMEGRARAASGAPPRWTARGFMLMGRVTMASVELTVILTLCLWPRFLRVLLVQMLGLQVRRTRIL